MESRVYGGTYIPVIPALRRLRQEHCEFQASLSYTGRVCHKKGVAVVILCMNAIISDDEMITSG
jgi:hypothetical protein